METECGSKRHKMYEDNLANFAMRKIIDWARKPEYEAVLESTFFVGKAGKGNPLTSEEAYWGVSSQCVVCRRQMRDEIVLETNPGVCHKVYAFDLKDGDERFNEAREIARKISSSLPEVVAEEFVEDGIDSERWGYFLTRFKD